MSTKSKSLTKSLHTVSVLASLGAYLNDCHTDYGSVYAVEQAAAILGYETSDDTLGLIPRAVAILESVK